MDQDQFRKMMGLIDSGSSSMVLNRVYSSICTEGNVVTFEDFVKYLDTLINGSQKDKTELCFRMLDSKKVNYLTVNEFKSLILAALITNNDRMSRAELDVKADTITMYIFQKYFPSNNNATKHVTLEEFNNVVEQDQSLLDIFTLLSRGVTDSIIPPTEANTELNKYLGHARYINSLARSLLEDYEHPKVQASYNIGKSITPLQVSHPHLGLIGGNQLHHFQYGEKFSSDFGLNRHKADLTEEPDDLELGIRQKSSGPSFNAKIKSARKSPGELSRIKNIEMIDKLEKLEKLGDSSKIPKQSTEPNKKIVSNLPTLVSQELAPEQGLDITKKSTIPTPKFALRHRAVEDISFADHKHVNTSIDFQTPRSKQVSLRGQNYDIPEEGSILSLKDDSVRNIMVRRMKETHNNLARRRVSTELKKIKIMDSPPYLLDEHAGGSRLDISDVRLGFPETTPASKKYIETPPHSYIQQGLRETPASVGLQKLSLKKIPTENDEYHNSLLSDGDLIYTDRGERDLIKKKLNDVVILTDEVLNKLKKEDAQAKQEKERTHKLLEKAAVNVQKPPSKEGVVFVFHKDWGLVINLMIGLNKSIRALLDLEEHSISKTDYKMRDRFELSNYRTLDTDSTVPQTLHFISFAPYIFADIRKKFGISSEQYLNSIGSDSLIANLIRGEVNAYRELISSGKSGSFFFYSVDGKYVIKTIKYEEYHFMKEILQPYHSHITQNPNTLIPKFYGLHEIITTTKSCKSCFGTRRIFLIIMDNIFGRDKTIQERYDLKGSTYNRSIGTQFNSEAIQQKVALKDLDFVKMNKKIKLSEERTAHYLEIIRKDCEFFESQSIIDYSLLVGIHNNELFKEDTPSDVGFSEYFVNEPSSDHSCLYFFGIIDILTTYKSIRKKLEYWSKRIVQGPGISCVPPNQYSVRFQEFIKSSVFATTK